MILLFGDFSSRGLEIGVQCGKAEWGQCWRTAALRIRAMLHLDLRQKDLLPVAPSFLRLDRTSYLPRHIKDSTTAMNRRAGLRQEFLGLGCSVLDAFQGRVLGSISYASANISCDARLLLPAAAEGLINLYQREEFVEPGLRQAEFCGEIVGFIGEDFEVAGGATLVALAGKLRGILG